MAPLRVAFDSGPLYGHKTGIGFAVEALRAALQQRPEVELHPYVLSFRAQLEAGVTRLPLPAAMAIRAWAHSGHPTVDRWLGDAQLVHGTNYVVPPTRRPALVSVYDCWFLRHPEQADVTVRRAGDVLRMAVQRGAAVHTSSHATADAVRELLPGAAVHTIHLAALPLHTDIVSTAPLAMPELGGRPFVLSIGTIERRKNLPRLVTAFGLVASEVPDLALVLAGGPGDDSPAVDAAIDALPAEVAHRVVRTGRVDEPVRSWLLSTATVIAYPSLDEGFGFPVLDAMQAGVPVVASTAGSIPEVAGDAALLVPADDTVAIAHALVTAVTDDATRRRLAAAGDAQWRRFSWQRCADEMVSLYGRLVQGDTTASS
jgi:glycosyltransferase involved in cell wall biosynthesis